MSIIQSGITEWFNEFFRSSQRGVGRVSAEVAKERIIACFLYKGHGFIKKNILTVSFGFHSLSVADENGVEMSVWSGLVGGAPVKSLTAGAR